MQPKFQEKGQALIIVALAAIVLFGLAALAIDGSMAYSDRRNAQNSADAAALAGALAYTRGHTINPPAMARALSDGYDNNGTTNTVTVTAVNVPPLGCPGNAGKDVTVKIVSKVNTSLARVIGTTQFTNVVSATARGCSFIVAPLFGGNAIVALNNTNNPCAFDSGNSHASHWRLQGGGIFSNGCAFSSWNGAVTLESGTCVTTVGVASNFTCMQQYQASQALSMQGVVDSMPANPCVPGGVGLPPPASGSTFSNGVYCISNMDQYDQKDIVLNNATLYVTDTAFDLKFAGGGGFSGTATSDPNSPYSNYYMIIAYKNPPCPAFNDHSSQIINFRGNGSGTFSGTILAPSACIDLRGNGESSGIHTQVIAYNVSSNGNAEVYINYNENENHRDTYKPKLTLLR